MQYNFSFGKLLTCLCYMPIKWSPRWDERRRSGWILGVLFGYWLWLELFTGVVGVMMALEKAGGLDTPRDGYGSLVARLIGMSPQMHCWQQMLS